MGTDVLTVVRCAIGAVFMRAAVGKLAHPVRFATGLAVYAAFPAATLRTVAALLIVLEFGLSLMLLAGRQLAVTLPIAIATLVLFAVLVQRRLSRGQTGPCLCFSTDDSEQISQRTIARLGLLIVGELWLLTGVIFQSGRDAQANDLRSFQMITVWTIIVLTLSTWVLKVTDALELFKVTIIGALKPVE